MTHRVRLDYTCADVHLSEEGIKASHPKLVQEALSRLTAVGWETARGSQRDEIFNRMAAELPDFDLPSFVRNTKVQMFRAAPSGELTLGYFSDEGTGHIRIRVRAANNAKIVDLGRRTATKQLELPALNLANMDLFESRDGESILQGREADSEPYRFFSRSNVGVAIPLIFAIIAILAGGGIAWRSYDQHWDARILGDSLSVWYGRLFAPLLMAIVTTLSVVVRDYRRAGERFAEWILD